MQCILQCIFLVQFQILYLLKEVDIMSFQLKPKKQTENKTIRFPQDLVNEIEKYIQNKDVTFSRFVIQACEYVLEDIEKDKNKHTN